MRQGRPAFQFRSRGHAEIHAEFGGDYAGQRCFSETRRSVKQHMIKIIPSQLHRVNIYFENLLCLLLSDILVHIERAKAHLVFVILGCRIRGYLFCFQNRNRPYVTFFLSQRSVGSQICKRGFDDLIGSRGCIAEAKCLIDIRLRISENEQCVTGIRNCGSKCG